MRVGRSVGCPELKRPNPPPLSKSRPFPATQAEKRNRRILPFLRYFLELERVRNDIPFGPSGNVLIPDETQDEQPMNRRKQVIAGAVVVLAAAFSSSLLMSREKPAAAAQKAAAQAPAQSNVERGRYLVEDVAMCEECHTPRDANGNLDESRRLQGAQIWIMPVHA